MNSQITIDSCVFVSALNLQEEHSDRCLDLLRQVNKGKYIAIIPTTVLVEVVAAIRRRTKSKKLAIKAKDFILNIKNLNFVDIDYSRTINMLKFVTENSLRGMDAIIVWTAKEFSCGLVTLDKEIKNLAKGKIKFVNL
ncbi:MAG: type II toxin-antitoxin system VapC family toxin [Patescibacteria group bacterium]